MSEIETILQTKNDFIPAVVCFLLKGNQVILGQRRSENGKGLISGAGGKIGDLPGKKYETPEEAVRRELQEEFEVDLIDFERVGQIRYIAPLHPQWEMLVHVFIATSWIGEPQETDSMIPVSYRIDQLPHSLMWNDAQFWTNEENLLGGQFFNHVYRFGSEEWNHDKVVEIYDAITGESRTIE